MKKCSTCKQMKDHSEFHRDKSRGDGLENKCKECKNKKNKAWREANPDYMKDWLAANPQYMQDWRRNNPDWQNNYWSGDAEGRKAYHDAHNAVRRLRGAAKESPCATPGCNQQARQWAYNHKDPNEQQTLKGIKFGTPEYYIPLCRPCHVALDRKVRESV